MKIKKTVREMAYNGKFFSDNAERVNGELTVMEHYTETCQYYALFFGVADMERDPEFTEMMINTFGIYRNEKEVYPDVDKSNMFIGNFLRLEILRRFNRYDKLVDECKALFMPMAERTSSLWENRVLSEEYLRTSVKGSCCHGFASVCGVFLTEAITGYRGYLENKVFMSKKHLDIDCEITVPLGDKDVLKLKNENGKINIDLPDGYSVEYV